MCSIGGIVYLVLLAAVQFRHDSHASSIEKSMPGPLLVNNAIPTYKFFRFPLAAIHLAFSLGHIILK